MRRLNNNRDLFEAPANQQITVTVEAVKVPFQATFANLESGAQWNKTQTPTIERPVDIRNLTMPAGSREFFVISYGFPPAAQTDANARYLITLSGGGTTDGPNDILPPPAGSTVDLPYEFRLPTVNVESLTTTASAAKKSVAGKAPAKGGGE